MGQKASSRGLITVIKDINISSGDVFKMSKRHLFCKSKQCLTEALIGHLKKTSQKCHQDTPKTTDEAAFKISKRQLFCKNNQCLRKPLFRQVIHIFGNCLGRISLSSNQFL